MPLTIFGKTKFWDAYLDFGIIFFFQNKSMQEGKDYISSHQEDIAQVADYM